MADNLDFQKESVKELLRLIKENPELPILPMVETECVSSDDCSWWVCGWHEPEIDEYWIDEYRERCYRKSNDLDELFERFFDEGEEQNPEIANQYAQKKVDDLPWIKAILVRIRPY